MLPVLAAAFVGFFAVANAFFPVIHVSLENPYGDAARLLAYSGIFLPSYAIFGALLALYFDEGAPSIGRLYFFDLAGAASGCLLAPLVLTWAGLPPAIMTVLFGALALLAATPLARRRLAVGAGAAGFCVVAFLAWRGSVFSEHPDVARLVALRAERSRPQTGMEEVRVRWNDLARTSLVRADTGNPTADAEAWGIVQDDGISNVKVARWDPAAKPADILPASLHHALPFLMGHEPKRILVLFAGVGRDMVELDGMAQGRADITGVELNPAVVDLVRDPLLAGMNLRAFHARPNIHLVVREGRDFLDNDRGRYDLLFVATNGATNDARTGHTRKYLDTTEAMASYLDHLAPGPGSMIVFVNQPVLHKAESLRLLFAERGLGDFGKAVFAFGAPETRGQDSMVVKPSGLTPDEIAAIERKVASWPHPRTVLYAPSGAGEPRFVDAVLGRTRGPLVTDDRPFVHEVSWRDFELLPAKARFIDQLYASSWIKVFTILLFGAVSVAVMACLLGLRRGRERRVPWPWVLYFFVAGLSYMCVEIGLIAQDRAVPRQPALRRGRDPGAVPGVERPRRVPAGPPARVPRSGDARAAGRGGHRVGRPRHAPVQRAPALAALAAQDPLRRAVRGARRDVPRDVLPVRRGARGGRRAPRGRARHLRHGHAVVGVGRVVGDDRHHQPGLLGRDPDGRRGLRADRGAVPRRAPPPPVDS